MSSDIVNSLERVPRLRDSRSRLPVLHRGVQATAPVERRWKRSQAVLQALQQTRRETEVSEVRGMPARIEKALAQVYVSLHERQPPDEVALAALMSARLARGVATGETLQLGERVTRAAAAKVWLASLALPATTRVPVARCVESTTGTSLDVAGALRSLVAAAGAHLDGPSVQELERLARQLAG